MLGYASIDKTDSFFIVGAKLADPDYLRSVHPKIASQRAEMGHVGVFAHRLAVGQGAVIGYRKYSNGELSMIDDETYEKITIWLPKGLPTSPIEVRLNDASSAVVLRSHGGSAWPRHDCTGFVTDGALQITPAGTHYAAKVSGRIGYHYEDSHSKECGSQTLEIVIRASKLNFAELTPWLGLEGKHVYDETYR